MERPRLMTIRRLTLIFIFLAVWTIIPLCADEIDATPGPAENSVISSSDAAATADEAAQPEPRINFRSIYPAEEIINLADYTERFEELDRHALDAPRSAKASLESLTEYLLEPAETDLEKVRVIYRWITDNISYDTQAYFSGRRAETSPAGVLRTGKSVCAGYSGLFKNLLDLAGVTSIELNGYAKGYGYDEGDHFTRTNHAWNAVQIDEKWYLIDSTWASGHVDGRTYKKRLQEYWFFTPPEKFIFSHFPVGSDGQLLENPIDQTLFEELPNLKHQVFNIGITFEQTVAELNSEDFRAFPKFYTFKYGTIQAVEMPLTKYLHKGEEYSFQFISDDITSIAVIQNRNFTYFDQSDQVFSLTIAPSRRGTMKVSYSKSGKHSTHWALIHYKVE